MAVGNKLLNQFFFKMYSRIFKNVWHFLHLASLYFKRPLHCEHFWFQKRTLKNSKNCKIFFIFPKFLPYLMIFPSSAAHLALPTLKNHQILKCFFQKMMKNLPIITTYYLNEKTICKKLFSQQFKIYIPYQLDGHLLVRFLRE